MAALALPWIEEVFVVTNAMAAVPIDSPEDVVLKIRIRRCLLLLRRCLLLLFLCPERIAAQFAGGSPVVVIMTTLAQFCKWHR